MAVFTDKLSHMDSSLENSYLIDGSGNSSSGCSEVLAGWGKGTEFQGRIWDKTFKCCTLIKKTNKLVVISHLFFKL